MAPVGQYLRYSTVFDEQANLRVLALAAALASTTPEGVREIYPGYGSVYVEWDDATLSNERATAWIDDALKAPEEALRDPQEITVPVRYGGLDTDDVAEATGLSADEIAKRHAEVEYRVCARATVGQPMMAVTDERLRVPRRPNPRTDVPALAVAIANEQATIYPALMPGGWNVIGTALVNVYDPHRDEPFAFGLGDRVRFEPRDGEPPEPPRQRPLLPAEPRFPAFRVEEPGALDLLLDGGRLNQSHHGMAQSGPLDARAARLANALAGNPPGATVIESTLNGPTLLALRDVVVGAAGRGLQLHVDDEPVGQMTTLVRKGQRVALRPTGKGVRGYLAFAGGIDAEPFLGSAERRPDRADRQPAQTRRRTRPGPRRLCPAGDAGAPAGGPVPPRAARPPRAAVVTRGRGGLDVGRLHRRHRRPDGRAPRRPGRARGRAAVGVTAARRGPGPRGRRADPAAGRPPAQRGLRQAGRDPPGRPSAGGPVAAGRTPAVRLRRRSPRHLVQRPQLRSSMTRFQDTCVLVTGAGHGIGRATAERFASEGARVGVNDIDAERAAETVAAIGDRAIPLVGDVGSQEDVTRMVGELVDAFGPVDVLVNNAALATYEATIRHFLEGDLDWWERIIRTNLTSVFLCSQAVAMSMARRRRGAIIHMSSGGATHAHRAMASYDAAKGGIEALTRSMALDLAPYGVRVNYVVPGLIRTYDISDELAAERGQVVPLQRLGTAEDMAGPIVFLASDDARYMTGSGVVVDGGVLVQQRSAPVDIFPVSQYPEVPAE